MKLSPHPSVIRPNNIRPHAGPLEKTTMFLEAANIFESPYIVPVAGCAMIGSIAVAGIASGNRKREIESQERLAAIAKGVPVPPTMEEVALTQGKPTSNAIRRRDNVRLAAIILLCGAAGLILFFVVLFAILHVTPVLCGAAAALIPFGIGLGLFIDARLQTRALEAASTPPTR